MQEYIVLLSKKHGQMKQAITKMTQESMECLEKTPDMKTKLELIDTLRTVTDGKVKKEKPECHNVLHSNIYIIIRFLLTTFFCHESKPHNRFILRLSVLVSLVF